jgi:ubiquinol-cytochrome c reductase cytochrome b subunit
LGILSIIFGSLLGDAGAERVPGRHGTNIRFNQSSDHADNLLWLHKLISDLGYCNTSIPKLQIRDNGTRSIIRFSTFTFSSFNWIHNAFYPNGEKVVPSCIEDYLTPPTPTVFFG